MNWINHFGESWYKELEEFVNSSNFTKIGQQIAQLRKQGKQIIPEQGSNLLFKAFRSTPYNKVKVVILGLSPYDTVGAFDGLAFSNSGLLKPQSSLKNILDEVENDIYNGLNIDRVTDLSLYNWAEQGVLLINTALTVEVGNLESHLNIWKPFTEFVISNLQNKNDIIWLLLGTKAHEYEKIIDNKSHLILKTSHPSFYSANVSYKNIPAFIGSRVFSKINEQLIATNKSEIIW